VFFAISDDGYHWRPLNGGKLWLPVEHPDALIRDPFLTRGPDREFHMVWTWGWHTQSIGYARSPDLVQWSEQREIPLMAGVPGTKNTWAPEIYWDSAKSRWLLIWSSTVEGRQEGNRIYSAMTRDFRAFSKPEAFTESWSEGPSAAEVGRDYIVYYDHYRDPKRYEAVRSPDLKHWTPIHEEMKFPENAKHGSFLRITEEERRRLEAARRE
jgi:beta-xylosidase